MKKSILLFAVVAFFTSMSFTSNGANKTVLLQNENGIISQQRPQKAQRMTPEERIKKEIETYQKTLSLTADQTTKIKKIFTDSAEAKKKEALASKESKQRPDRTKMLANMEKENKAIRAVLNDEQKVKFDTMIKEKKEKMEQRRNNATEKNNRDK